MIYKRGGTWWFEFRYNNQRVRESTHQGNARIARDAEAAFRLRLVKGEHGIARKDGAPTLVEFGDTFSEWVRSEKDNAGTREFYVGCYRRLCEYKPLGTAPLDKIDEDIIEGFKLWALKEHYSRTTVNRYLSTLRKALRYACRKKRIIDRVPVIELYPKEQSREYIFSDADYQHWLEIAPEPLRSASILAHDGGICRGELLALERNCVQLRDNPNGGFWGTLQIRRGLKRDARRRDIPITQDMAAVLHRLLAESKCGHVFTSLKDPSVPLSKNTLADQHRQMKGLGEFNPDAGLHTLRHTFLTEAGRYTQNVRALQLLAGHSNIGTTMRYIHPDAQDVVNIAAQVQEARAARAEAPAPSSTVRVN